jgi:peptide/nickel transport system permease protein
LVLLWVVSVVTFIIVRQAPGGPAILADPTLTRAQIRQMEENLGLNRPLHEQYVDWLSRVVRGDLGRSLNHSKPVSSLIAQRLPNTLLLGVTALLLSLLIGVPLGVISAVKRNSWVDYLGTFITLLTLSVPAFWLGIVFIIVFAVELQWLPSGGMRTIGEESLWDLAKHLILPAIVASGFTMANLARYTRASVLEVLAQDYVRTARGKGLSETRVLVRHVLRNALIPIVTVLGLSLPQMVAGAAITETVFAWPGMGWLGVEAAANSDYPLILGITLVVAATVIFANLLTDITYVFVDPRIRLT